jgi:hypothetical protein
MNETNNLKQAADQVVALFLRTTGLSKIETSIEPVGPDTFLNFHVGREEAKFYFECLGRVDDELPMDHLFRGRVTLKVVPVSSFLESPEADLLRVLISRSLIVERQKADSLSHIEFVPFRRKEDMLIVQPANHLVVGRRGVGKSTLILIATKKIRKQGDMPIWLELQPYHRRADSATIIDVLCELIRELLQIDLPDELRTAFDQIRERFSNLTGKFDIEVNDLRREVPALRQSLEQLTKKFKRNIFVFLDNLHLLAPSLQPELLDILSSSIHGTNTWLKVAFVKHLGRHYDRARNLGLRATDDAQFIDLDLTLTDPEKARKHLVEILDLFLKLVGITRRVEIIPEQAINRLVWCSAGVVRDFLKLFSDALGYAQEHGHKSIGVQDVNLALGDSAQVKLRELEDETSEETQAIKKVLEQLLTECLDKRHKNAFLVRQLPNQKGYQILQELVGLRLVHLIHPSITPKKAGERYEAYLLDHSFYTGMRRRKEIQEVQIGGSRPKHAELRSLPRIDLETLIPTETDAEKFDSQFETEFSIADHQFA